MDGRSAPVRSQDQPCADEGIQLDGVPLVPVSSIRLLLLAFSKPAMLRSSGKKTRDNSEVTLGPDKDAVQICWEWSRSKDDIFGLLGH